MQATDIAVNFAWTEFASYDLLFIAERNPCFRDYRSCSCRDFEGQSFQENHTPRSPEVDTVMILFGIPWPLCSMDLSFVILGMSEMIAEPIWLILYNPLLLISVVYWHSYFCHRFVMIVVFTLWGHRLKEKIISIWRICFDPLWCQRDSIYHDHSPHTKSFGAGNILCYSSLA